jgi:pyruvate-ferredoxin/flavodoxin oxidoreductase
MPGFSNSALRLFQRLLNAPNTAFPSTGLQTVLDGNTAIAATEACIAEAAGIGGTFPADAATFAWQAEQQRRGKNCFGKTLTGRDSDGPRGALAAAIGLSLSGARATAFLSSPDLMMAQDLLVNTVGRHVPIVIHLTNRTLAGHAGAIGSGHKAYHVSADSGFFVLQASTVQEAVDFTLIARRVAELSLLPGIVAMDGEQIALAPQEVQLPHPDLVRRFLGEPDEQIPVPTPAQKLLFGDTRRRVPRWHDPDRPVMHGALQGPESWSLGSLSKHPYFNHHLTQILEESFSLLSQYTQRPIGPVSNYQTDNAQLVLVAQGSAIENLQAVADHLRQTRKLKVGVLGIHCFRPFPGAQIAEHLKKKRIVAVLERVDTPLAGDPPLMRQVRAALERALENGRLGTETGKFLKSSSREFIHPDYPAIKEKDLPRFRSVVYGLGGHPLRAADIVALCDNVEEKGRGRIFLGVEFARASSLYPKRQVLLDNLRRAYPDIVQMGLRSQQASPDTRPTGAFTVAIHNLSDHGGKGLSVEAAVFLHHLNGGYVRSRPGVLKERWLSGWLDQFTYSPLKLRDPGDDSQIDIAVLTAPQSVTQPLTNLRKGGVLLAVSPLEEAELWQTLSPNLRDDIQHKQIQLYRVAIPEASLHYPLPALLGGLLGTLLNTGFLDLKVRRIINNYEDSLQHLPETERTTRLEYFKAGLETVQQVHYQTLEVSASEPTQWHDEAPLAVRHLGHSKATYDSLPRFWDQVGVLYRNGETAEMTPDPYLALGTIPPLSSTFRDLSGAREMLPAFDPNACTGCGKCWTRCPDSAIGSVVLSPATLIEASIKLAKAEALQMISSQLVRRLQSLARDNKLTYTTAGEFLQAAFVIVQQKMRLTDERKQTVTEAFNTLIQKIGDWPLARTDAFFYEQERYQYDTGELLSLVINPDACKACGLCISACEPKALTAVAQTSSSVVQAHQRWQLWEQLPDTAGKTIDLARKHPDVGPMPAILLSRYCQMAIAGGDNAEAGSGEKAAVRLALAVMEFQRQPLLNRFLEDIAETLQKLNAKVRDILSKALPTDDMEALSAGLDALEPTQMSLSSITAQIDSALTQDLVDAKQLRRFVKLSQGLNELYWQLSKGEQGLGRSRLSLAIAPGTLTGWAGSWPNNPFQVPVAVDMSGDTAQLASGLLEGQLREATEGIVLLRRAKFALENPDEIPSEELHWRDLTVEEQRLCPPLLLLGNDEVLAGQGFSAISRLLGTDLPIKVMILADLDLDLGTADVAGIPMAAVRETKTDPGLLALSQRHAYLAQTSIADATHFLTSVEEAFEFTGPAIIHVHAPSPEQHGFATDQTFVQASRAIATRVFPLFTYDPNREGVFGSRLNLDNNPTSLESWHSLDKQILTPANWALHEQRFAPYFSPLTDADQAPTPITDYLKLDNKARLKKTPVVTIMPVIPEGGKEEFQPVEDKSLASSETNEEAFLQQGQVDDEKSLDSSITEKPLEEKSANLPKNQPIQLKVAPALVTACEERLHAWRTLQELAGLVTPFTATVEAKLRAELKEAHQAELEAMKNDYEARLENQRAEIEAEITGRVQSRLLALAGYN